MKTPPVEGWVHIRTREPIYIPTPDGSAIAETRWVEVDAWRDPESDEIFLDNDAIEKLDAAKARYLGILTPDQLCNLRTEIGITQKEMAGILQLGEKTWTRWETGSERPSRSMNVLLTAIFDGKVDINYLRELATPGPRSKLIRWKPTIKTAATHYEQPEQSSWSPCDAQTQAQVLTA